MLLICICIYMIQYVPIYLYAYVCTYASMLQSRVGYILKPTLQDPRSGQAQRDAPSAHFVAVVALARSDRSAHEALVSEQHPSSGSGFPASG